LGNGLEFRNIESSKFFIGIGLAFKIVGRDALMLITTGSRGSAADSKIWAW
jgi:hypothetical protein